MSLGVRKIKKTLKSTAIGHKREGKVHIQASNREPGGGGGGGGGREACRGGMTLVGEGRG